MSIHMTDRGLMSVFMVIDEDYDSLALARRVLSQNGHSVLTFGSIDRAAPWLERNRPDLAIVNVGRQGEKARFMMGIMKFFGLDPDKIVLFTGSGSLRTVKDDFSASVKDVVGGPLTPVYLKSIADKA